MKHEVIGANEILSFGKYKNSTLRAVIADDPGYALWLRDEKTKTGTLSPYDGEANALLNEQLAKDKRLARKFKPWVGPSAAPSPGLTVTFTPSTYDASEPPVETIRAQRAKEQQYAARYGEVW